MSKDEWTNNPSKQPLGRICTFQVKVQETKGSVIYM
jgi:hypothetical protein